MLKRLRIQNFAIIDEIAIELGQGLNIISGETGAGKSILMGALTLILGGRASTDLIRSGAEEATVEALFEIPKGSAVQRALEEQSLDGEEGELILRRIVQRSGKNRIFVNGHLASMATLQTVTGSLVDLCSQHDQQLLARPEEHLFWVDRFGELEETREHVSGLYREWREKRAALEALNTDATQRAQRIDFLRFQIQELEDAAILSPKEDEEIETEIKVLGNAENLFAFAAEAESLVFGSDAADMPPLLDGVGALLLKAKTMAAADPKLTQAIELLGALKLHGEELGHFLRAYSQGLQRDEGRLEALHARHALLTKLRRKYGPSLADALANLEAFRSELSLLENHDSSLAGAREVADSAFAQLDAAARKLSSARARKSREFSEAVMRELEGLHMNRARFQATLIPLAEPGPLGRDGLRFEIAANPGEPMGPLNKVASGGELSRVMLAMHNVVSSRSGVGVYLFDEVDSGIGGMVAVAVGKKLRRVASQNQVICITHLPQVASFGNIHFRVDKSVEKMGKPGERTVCRVARLSHGERELEVARMLGGLGNHEAALANARAMLADAEGEKTRVKPVAKPSRKPVGTAVARRGA